MEQKKKHHVNFWTYIRVRLINQLNVILMGAFAFVVILNVSLGNLSQEHIGYFGAFLMGFLVGSCTITVKSINEYCRLRRQRKNKD